MTSTFRTLLAALLLITTSAQAQIVPGAGGGIVPGYNTYTASRVLVTDTNGKPVTSGITTTQLNTLSGISSNIQTQLNGKQPLDADLTAISALTGTDTIYYRSGVSTWSPVTIGSNLTFSGGTLAATGGGGGPTLQTDGTPNGDQNLLNLAAGTNITLTDNGTGTVTIDAAGGSGSPAGSTTQVQYNESGAFAADANFTRDTAANNQDTTIKAENVLDPSAFVQVTTTGGTRGEFHAENSVNNSEFFVEADTMGMTSTNQVGLIGSTVISQTTSGGVSLNLSGANQGYFTTGSAGGLVEVSGQGAAAYPKLAINYDSNAILSNSDNADYAESINLSPSASTGMVLDSNDAANNATSTLRLQAGSTARLSDNNNGKTNSLDLGTATHGEWQSTDNGDNTDKIVLYGDGSNGVYISSGNNTSTASMVLTPDTASITTANSTTISSVNAITLNSNGGVTKLGDTLPDFNGTRGTIDDTTQTIDFEANVGINLNSKNGVSKIGDTNLVNNGTLQTIDDTTSSVSYVANTAFTADSDHIQLGKASAANNTYLDILDSSQNVTINNTGLTQIGGLAGGNDTKLEIDDTAQQITLNTTGIATIGDALGGANSTLIATNDATSQIDINSRGIVQIGDLAPFANNTTITANDPAKTIALNSSGVITVGDTTSAGNDTVLTVDDTAQQIRMAGGIVFNEVSTSVDYTVLPNDYYVDVGSSGGAVTITLPSVASFPGGKTLVITDKTGNALTNNITLLADGSDTINGAGSYTMNLNRQSVTIHTDGVSAWVIN